MAHNQNAVSLSFTLYGNVNRDINSTHKAHGMDYATKQNLLIPKTCNFSRTFSENHSTWARRNRGHSVYATRLTTEGNPNTVSIVFTLRGVEDLRRTLLEHCPLNLTTNFCILIEVL